MPTELSQATALVAIDPMNPSVVIPVYAGGDAPTPLVPSDPALRGDIVGEVTPPVVEPVVEPPAAIEPVIEAPAAIEPVVIDTSPPATEPPRDAKGQFIPKSRFDEVNTRMKVAERALADRDAAAAAAAAGPAFDFNAAEREYMELVLDGKLDEAGAKRGEIRAAEQALYITSARDTVVEVTSQKSVETRIVDLSAGYESQYDEFNPDSPAFSEEVLDTVQALMTGHSQSGKYADAAAAFEAAVNGAIKMFQLQPKQSTAPVVVPAVTPPTAVPAVPPRTAASRVAAIVGQPPVLAGVGTSNANSGELAIDVNAISDRDLQTLPKATISRLRGDFV